MQTRQLGRTDMRLTTVGLGKEDIEEIERLLARRDKKLAGSAA